MKKIIVKNIQTPEFPYGVVWIYPLELCNEEILKTNLSNTEKYLKELMKETDKKKYNEDLLNYVKFDIQKEIPLKLIEKCNQKIETIKEKINENISPYYWRILRDFQGYFDDIDEYIKTDFLLVLSKRECND